MSAVTEFRVSDVLGPSSLGYMRGMFSEEIVLTLIAEARKSWEERSDPEWKPDLETRRQADTVLAHALEELTQMKVLPGNRWRLARLLVAVHVETLAISR